MSIDSETSRRNRRSSIARTALALLALLGIGLGVTTAVWSDNVWFTTSVSTKTFNLQGSLSGADDTWKDSATEAGVDLVIPNTIWAGLEPGKTVSTKIWVKNAGTAAAVMELPKITLANAAAGLTITNATTGLTVTTTGLANGDVLAASAVKEITVSIKAGDDLVQGGSGDLRIQLSGKSQA
ncbi:MAG TPA: hypothetical protein PLQ63_12475 [Propionicimonas sp.]|nr:hypothetical protein [Propionicimonas sp.]